MNKFWKIFATRRFFWPLLLLPGIWRLVIPAMTDGLGFNPLFELLHRTGQIAIWLLVVVLSLTPLKTLFPRAKFAAALNRHRRAIGVSAFIYAALHVTEHFLYEGEFAGYFKNIWKPFFLTGTFGIVVLTLLGATSNNFSVTRLRYARWKWLHRLVYIAAIALAWHVATAGKGNWPFARKVFIPLLALQVLRVAKPLATRIRRRNEWIDWREFEITRRENESDTIMSFYLRPVDGHALPAFQPGQFLTVQLEIPDQPKPVARTYTISDAPNPKTYRLTIKREPPPANPPNVLPGLVSNFFHDRMIVGAKLRAKPPAGKFCLETDSHRPVVLISAGVGVTPTMAMLNALIASRVPQPIWFLHAARNRREHAFGKHVRALPTKLSNFRVHICYSQPSPGDVAEKFCDSEGRLDIALVKRLLPSHGADFYLCGPGPFMKSFYDGLRAWGVPAERIHYEFFGPATVKLAEPDAANPPTSNTQLQIKFNPPGETLRWDGTSQNLLEFALNAGLKPRYGCKAGVCGSCACRLVEGKVHYEQQPAAPIASGEVLLCCAQPESDVTVAL